MTATSAPLDLSGVEEGSRLPPQQSRSELPLLLAGCCICEADDADPVGVGEDFEQHATRDLFLTLRCRTCGLVYLNPRPADGSVALPVDPPPPALAVIARSLLPRGARVLLLGSGSAGLESALRLSGAAHTLEVLETASCEPDHPPAGGYDVVWLAPRLDELPDPVGWLERAVGCAGGGAVVVTALNTGSAAFRLFQGRYWAGYRFPRHGYFFHERSLRALARRAGLDVESVRTVADAAEWMGSIRHALTDLRAPAWLRRRFDDGPSVARGAFSALSRALAPLGLGGQLVAVLRRPRAVLATPRRPARKSGSRPPIAVLGGGIGGLVAARALRAAGAPVVLYEAGKQLAGMATSFTDADGFSYDFGAHFITNRLAAALGVGAVCREVRHYGETVLLAGRTYSYPFGLLRRPRFTRDAVRRRAGAMVSRSVPASAAEWTRAAYGDALANDVAIPLLEAWSGAAAAELSPAVLAKVNESVVQTMWLKAASHLMHRAVGMNYCRSVPEGAHVWHVYPEGGVATLCRQAAVGIEDSVRLESPVQEIIVDAERAVAIRVHGREIPVSGVVSTAPVHVLPKLIRGTDALAHLTRFRFRPMIFVNMRFEGRGLLPDVVTWTPEPGFPFFRLTEAILSMPWLAPEGKTMLTADIGCEVGDDLWRMEDEGLGELCLAHMDPLVPDARRRYLGCRVLRTPIAYPVFLNSYELDRQRLERGTGIDGLFSIGRNGEFAHILMEDIYWRTLRRVPDMLRAGGFK